jgi:hypothetical protein
VAGDPSADPSLGGWTVRKGPPCFIRNSLGPIL